MRKSGSLLFVPVPAYWDLAHRDKAGRLSNNKMERVTTQKSRPQRMRIDKDQLASLVQPLLDEDSEFVVAVAVSPQGFLRVLLDSMTGLTIDRCAQISRAIEEQLDREKEDFSLEVSSAGLGESFSHPLQYLKHCGNPVAVLLQSGERLLGTLRNADEKGFTIGVDKTIAAHVDSNGKKQKKQVVEELHTFAYDEVKSTKYRF